MVNLVIGKSQHTNILSVHKSVPPTVIFKPVGLKMSTSVYFNDQFSGGAVEVGNIWAEWLLTAKMEGMTAQIQKPELSFLRSHIFSKFTGTRS